LPWAASSRGRFKGPSPLDVRIALAITIFGGEQLSGLPLVFHEQPFTTFQKAYRASIFLKGWIFISQYLTLHCGNVNQRKTGPKTRGTDGPAVTEEEEPKGLPNLRLFPTQSERKMGWHPVTEIERMMIVGLPLPKLENEAVLLQPLEERDYPALYDLGRDPKIWEQHPQSDRWQEEVFRRFFDEGIRSRGAYRIIEKSSGSLAGTTRIYDADASQGTIKVGYTFLATRFWGTGLNRKVKELLLNELFSNFQSVFFEIGSRNLRSRIAIERLGARLVEEEKREGAASGEPARLLYRIPREEWMSRGGSARD